MRQVSERLTAGTTLRSELTRLQRPTHRAVILYDAAQSQDVDGCVRLAPLVAHSPQARRLVDPGVDWTNAVQIDVAVEPDDLISRIKERIEEMEGASPILSWTLTTQASRPRNNA